MECGISSGRAALLWTHAVLGIFRLSKNPKFKCWSDGSGIAATGREFRTSSRSLWVHFENTCLVFALLLQLREPEECLDTGSVGLALIYIYLENLTSRHVVSSWKKHWGLKCLQAQGWGLEETTDRLFCIFSAGWKKSHMLHPFTLTQENRLTNLHILLFLRQSRRIWENRNNANCNKWINFILTQGLVFRCIDSILKSFSFHPDSLSIFYLAEPSCME